MHVLLLAAVLGALSDPVDPLRRAEERFLAAPLLEQLLVLAEIEQRIEDSAEPALRRVLELRDRARRELPVHRAGAPGFFAPEDYAPAQPARHFVAADSLPASLYRERFARHAAEPLYFGRVTYDFGRNAGIDHGAELSPPERLWNYFFGYPPDADLLVAWLERELDHAGAFDATAGHFRHAYCDLNGNASAEFSLYDAFAAMRGVNMPDVDVIAYAREVLHVDRYRSPIPPGADQQELYATIHADFLDYFRHRTLVEYCANLLLNPEAPIDWAHEPIRERLLYALHLDDLDVARLRARLLRTGDRGGLIAEIDAAAAGDDSWRWYGRQAAARINEPRWIIAHLVYGVLRERGFLEDAGG